MVDGAAGIEELSPIGERIRRDIHYAHHQRTFAEFKTTGTQFPLKSGAHAAIVNSSKLQNFFGRRYWSRDRGALQSAQ